MKERERKASAHIAFILLLVRERFFFLLLLFLIVVFSLVNCFVLFSLESLNFRAFRHSFCFLSLFYHCRHFSNSRFLFFRFNFSEPSLVDFSLAFFSLSFFYSQTRRLRLFICSFLVPRFFSASSSLIIHHHFFFV